MLTDAILPIETAEGRSLASLPEALARLCDATLVAFDGQLAHQRHAWFLFLCQVSAMALHRSGEANAVDGKAAWQGLANADLWRGRLAGLTPGCADTAWSLVVDDLTKPAFMQPPIRTGGLQAYKLMGATPDEIDVLVTAKAHDVKPARAGAAAPHHWLYALVALQTMQGYSGRGNFGIARMNGGFASRPMVMLTATRDLPSRFRRGVQAALAARREALDLANGPFDENGLPLLWSEPWDEDTGLGLDQLDPLFVEIARRARLVHASDGGITAWGRPTTCARVAAPKEAKGDLADPWTPINAKEGSALTVSGSGFDYRLVHRLLSEGEAEFRKPAAMRLTSRAMPESAWLHAAVLVRGQGKTEGLHERWLRVRGRTVFALSRLDHPPPVGAIGQGMIHDADAAKTALRTALRIFLQGGPDKVDFKDDRVRDVADSLDQRIDGIFFDHLFDRVDAADDEGRQLETEGAWKRSLIHEARTVFAEATARLSPPETRRERARAIAEMTFEGMLRKAQLSTGKQRLPEEVSA